jgi:hypothetical protein
MIDDVSMLATNQRKAWDDLSYPDVNSCGHSTTVDGCVLREVGWTSYGTLLLLGIVK